MNYKSFWLISLKEYNVHIWLAELYIWIPLGNSCFFYSANTWRGIAGTRQTFLAETQKTKLTCCHFLFTITCAGNIKSINISELYTEKCVLWRIIDAWVRQPLPPTAPSLVSDRELFHLQQLIPWACKNIIISWGVMDMRVNFVTFAHWVSHR